MNGAEHASSFSVFESTFLKKQYLTNAIVVEQFSGLTSHVPTSDREQKGTVRSWDASFLT